MGRMRLGVVLLLPDPVAIEVDGLRRALGDGQRDRIAPHITLVPPVNVRVGDLPAALALVRSAASSFAPRSPLALRLGPPRSFHPDSDTLYLAVDDDAAAAMAELRAAMWEPPLAREVEWPYVPHVTVADRIEAARAAAAVAVLHAYAVTTTTDRLHLLEERRRADGRRHWVPVADAPFERPAVVGRGGIELELTRSTLVDPEVRAFVAAERDADDDLDAVLALPPGATPVIVAARRRGELVGVAVGWTAGGAGSTLRVIVAQAHRRQGIARQLVLALEAG